MFIHPGHIMTDTEPKEGGSTFVWKVGNYYNFLPADLPRSLHSVTLHTNECLLIVFQFTAAVSSKYPSSVERCEVMDQKVDCLPQDVTKCQNVFV